MTDCPDLPDWLPDPPMALADEWHDWRDAALDWIAEQDDPWTADEMRAALPPGRSNWPGSAIRTASGRKMIQLYGMCRSTHPTRKKSLLAIWQTTHTPKETP